MVAFAGEEDRCPWRLAPIRILAIVATVGVWARRWEPRRPRRISESPSGPLWGIAGSGGGGFSGRRPWGVAPRAWPR